MLDVRRWLASNRPHPRVGARAHRVGDRLHVQLRRVWPDQAGPFLAALSDELADLPVEWVDVRLLDGLLVLRLDEPAGDDAAEVVVRAVEAAESRSDVAGNPFPEHRHGAPVEDEPRLRAAAEVAADVFSFGLGVTLRARRARQEARLAAEPYLYGQGAVSGSSSEPGDRPLPRPPGPVERTPSGSSTPACPPATPAGRAPSCRWPARWRERWSPWPRRSAPGCSVCSRSWTRRRWWPWATLFATPGRPSASTRETTRRGPQTSPSRFRCRRSRPATMGAKLHSPDTA